MKKITKEIREKNIRELEKESQKLREEIAKGKLEAKVNQPKNTNGLFIKRKKLAVVLTVLGEKKEIESLKQIKVNP